MRVLNMPIKKTKFACLNFKKKKKHKKHNYMYHKKLTLITKIQLKIQGMEEDIPC